MKKLIIECEAPEDLEILGSLASLDIGAVAVSWIYRNVPSKDITARIEERDEPNKVQPSS